MLVNQVEKSNVIEYAKKIIRANRYDKSKSRNFQIKKKFQLNIFSYQSY